MKEKRANVLTGWKEIAEYLGCSVATAARREKQGLPVFHSGGQICAFPEDIIKWFKRQRLTHASPRIMTEEVTTLNTQDDIVKTLTYLLSDENKQRIAIINLGVGSEKQQGIANDLLASERFQLYLEVLPFGLIVCDEINKVVYCNKSVVALLGYSNPSEVMDRDILEFIKPSSTHEFKRIRLSVFNTWEIEKTQVDIILRNSPSIPIHLVVVPVTDEHGSFSEYLLILNKVLPG
jgi:PAS domain S-box-containing protein